MNAISVLFPYRHEGMWVFDDPDVGLRKEPFVCGIDDMITRMVASIPDAAGRVWRQLVLVSAARTGGLALPRPVHVFRESANQTLRVRRTEECLITRFQPSIE